MLTPDVIGALVGLVGGALLALVIITAVNRRREP